MSIQLTPNSNWKKAAVECSNGEYYNGDIEHGTDYAFGIKSLRLYLARCKINASPATSLTYSVPDMLIANKNLPSGGSNIDFIVPPSTKQIVVWIQDTSAGTNGKIPLTRFKTRQYTGSSGIDQLNQFGPWAKTYDERLESIQLTFGGITKPMSNFQRAGSGSISDPTVNTMLQRWLMSNQNNRNRQSPEKYTDWLSMGAYYYFDFEKSQDNLGTYLQVKLKFNGNLPSRGNAPDSMCRYRDF